MKILISYWSLIKSLQTFLLLITGLAGFISSRCPVINIEIFITLTAALFFTISGTTVLNMVYDKDIDAKMLRTVKRPLPSGKISKNKAIVFGIILLITGLSISFSLSLLFGIIMFSGFFIDFVIYTIWLKRKSAWSILWGGISGGMPILAGRALGIGEVDMIGLLLSLSILLWIPTHILTFNMKHINDYMNAKIPTFPSEYGFNNTRKIIALSSIGAAVAIIIGTIALGLSWGFIRVLIILALGSIVLAVLSIIKPSEKVNFSLFKYASIFMLGSIIIILFGTI